MRRKLLKPPTAATSRSAPLRNGTSNSTQNFRGGETEENSVFMTRSLNGAVSSNGLSSNGLSSNGLCSVVGSTAANPAPDCEYCRTTTCQHRPTK